MSLSIGFAGTPAFAASALRAILGAGFAVALVLTRPDRPRGRGLKLEPSPVKALAQTAGLPVLQPPTLKTPEARAPVVAVPVDVLVVAAYGLILPPAVLSWPRHGCLNIHASRLPRWRGAAPIQRALLEGDAATGVTIMQMDTGLDTGPVVEVVDVPIVAGETAGTLHDKLASVGAQTIVAVLRRLARDGRLVAHAQPPEGATYAHKIARGEAAIDWEADAEAIDRQIRAFDPVPGAYTAQDGGGLKLWRARPIEHETTAAPGTILSAGPDGIDVACGRGALRILELQPAGGRRMPVGAFLAGHFLVPGTRFSPTPESPVAGAPQPR
jgi:methionyl-tRNA formyltransferase